MADWTVSFSDVVKHRLYKPGSDFDLDRILWDYGMDVSRGYDTDGRHLIIDPDEEVEELYGRYHRSVFTGEISDGPRYIGKARTEGPWARFVDWFLEV